MFPIRDENPTLRTPVTTITIIAINVLAWFLVQGAGSDMPLLKSLCYYSLVPGDLIHSAPPGTTMPLAKGIDCPLDGRFGLTTLVTHAFLHGGWFHIISNMWFLWVFGDNVEDAMGKVRFSIFYFLCTLAAALAQIFSNPSVLIPMVGASGAVGGVMGAYARLYPKAHIHMIIPLGFFITTAAVPAVYMLGYWFVIQVVSGIPAIGGEAQVAFWAHAGGFIAGLLLAGPMHRQGYLEEHNRLGLVQTAKRRW